MRLKLNSGKKSSTLTIAWISFWFCLFAITLGLIQEISINGNSFQFRLIDASLVFALLGPSFGLYGFRRYSEEVKPKNEDLIK